MNWVIGSFVVVALCLAARAVLRGIDRGIEARLAGAFEAAMRDAGFEVVYAGQPFLIERRADGLAVQIHGLSLRAPIGAPHHDEDGPPRARAGLITFDDPGPDLLVATRSFAADCMGPVPSVPRVRTGHSEFDVSHAAYSLAPLSVPAPLLDALARRELAWLQRRDGRTAIALGRVEPVDVLALVELAARWRQASASAASQPTPWTPLPSTLELPLAEVTPPKLADPYAYVIGLLILGPLVAMLLLQVTPLSDMLADIGCADGALRVVSSHEGCESSYGFVCGNGREASGWIVAAAWLVVVAVGLGIATLAALRRLVAWRAGDGRLLSLHRAL